MPDKNTPAMTFPMTASEAAKALNADAKYVRSILRSICAETPGSGGRWEIADQSMLDAIKGRIGGKRGNGRKVVATLKVTTPDAS